MADIAQTSLFSANLPLFGLVCCAFFAVNLATMPLRMSVHRIAGQFGSPSLAFAVRILIYAVIPALSAGMVTVYLLPALMHSGYPLKLVTLFHFVIPISKFALLLAGVAVIGITLPYANRFLYANPYLIETICAVVFFMFYAHHTLYSGYPSILESPAHADIFPCAGSLIVTVTTVFAAMRLLLYAADRVAGQSYAKKHFLRKRLLPAVCATLTQLMPLFMISQSVFNRFETVCRQYAKQPYFNAPYSQYVELYMYAELYKMIDSGDLGIRLFEAVKSKPYSKRYSAVTARFYNLPEHSPLTVQITSNNWRNVALWYNKQ
ncbi:MAG: hypothetical protein RBU23_01535 [Candidatus Auribacterota bacterium]|jgi:hypothetical protein|nr:hypothetical protein [Candidatus Auribacterota bacterium]